MDMYEMVTALPAVFLPRVFIKASATPPTCKQITRSENTHHL
jgi:hypothetical protein